MTTRRRAYPGVLIMLLFVLAGCFQQAGESFTPVSSTGLPANVPGDQNPPPTLEPGGLTGDQSLTSFPATSTLPIAITVVSPTRVLPASSTPEIIPFDTTPTEAIPGFDTATPQIFVTPVSPLGPFTAEPIVPPASTGLSVGSATPSGLVTPTALPGFTTGTTSECTYVVQSGDNLYRIALNNEVSLTDLRAANPQITGDLIQPGDELTLPGCAADGSSAPVDTGIDNTGSDITSSGGGTTYVVQSGDTLFTIARRFGVTMRAIQEANNLPNPDVLAVGQELIIPAPAP